MDNYQHCQQRLLGSVDIHTKNRERGGERERERGHPSPSHTARLATQRCTSNVHTAFPRPVYLPRALGSIYNWLGCKYRWLIRPRTSGGPMATWDGGSLDLATGALKIFPRSTWCARTHCTQLCRVLMIFLMLSVVRGMGITKLHIAQQKDRVPSGAPTMCLHHLPQCLKTTPTLSISPYA
jgi:hypothetical protein